MSSIVTCASATLPCTRSETVAGVDATSWQETEPAKTTARARRAKPKALLPLDGRRRLGRDVIDHPVDTFDFVDDARRDPREQVVWQASPVGGHTVARKNGPYGDGFLVGTPISHDADRTNR